MKHRHLLPLSRRLSYSLRCFQQSTHKSYTSSALSSADFNSLLNTITRNAYPKCGAQVHPLIITNGFLSVSFLINGLMNMYAKCGLLKESLLIFHGNHQKNVVSWTTIISSLAQSGRSLDALGFFSGMRRAGIWPNQYTLSAILPAFSDTRWSWCGQQVHSLIYKSGFQLDVFVSSSLVGMYLKCLEFGEAWKVFVEMPERNLVSWNTMIVGCNQNGMYDEAFKLFSEVLKEGIHVLVLKLGLESLPFVDNAMIDMYSKCGSLEDSVKLFKGSSVGDVVTWNIMMMGWAKYRSLRRHVSTFR